METNKKTYFLPTGAAEHERLDIQHAVWKLALGDCLYVAKDTVRKVLREHDGRVPAVMDMGTGSGRWAIEMAEEFPHASVVGLDVSPPTFPSTSSLPSNCRIEKADANDSDWVEKYQGSFDVVHARSLETGVYDFREWVEKAARVLRDGGVLLLGAGQGPVAEDGKPHSRRAFGDPEFSWVEYIFTAIEDGLHREGNFRIGTCRLWTEWLRQSPKFKDVENKVFWVPIGPWKQNMTEKEVEASELLRRNIIRLVEGHRSLLVKFGWSDGAVEQAVENARKELEELTVHSYIQWWTTSAVRTSVAA